MKAILAAFALTLAGCTQTVQHRTVQVPVRISCVAAVPAKPSRVTPCPKDIADSQCVKRAAVDIERLQSAVDTLTDLVEACQ